MKKALLCLALLGAALLALAGMNNTSTFTASSLADSIVATGNQDGYSVLGKPSVSADFINRVLAAYNSPAAGTGYTLYSLGVQYGIDPAFALAWFQHESTFGKYGVARYTLGLGNIRCTPGYSCIAGFRAYSSYQDGYADWYQLIRNLYVGKWHLLTVEQIVATYAPSSDHNDVAAYIGSVEQSVRAWRAGRVA